jgi:hypothetical protein
MTLRSLGCLGPTSDAYDDTMTHTISLDQHALGRHARRHAGIAGAAGVEWLRGVAATATIMTYTGDGLAYNGGSTNAWSNGLASCGDTHIHLTAS